MILLSGKDRVDETKQKILDYKEKNKSVLSSLSFYFFSDPNDKGSAVYIRSLKRILSEFSLPYEEGFYDANRSEEENLKAVKNHADRNATMIFRPLPTQRETEYLSLLNPDFDPDRLSKVNGGRLFFGDRDYLPATVKSIHAILKHYQIPLDGKKAVVLGRSVSLGLPCFLRLSKENRMVTQIHSHTNESMREERIKNADLIVLASGKRGLVNPSWLNNKQTIIDCGFIKGGELGFAPDIYAYTPVPGGVGALTPYYLVLNARQEYRKQSETMMK